MKNVLIVILALTLLLSADVYAELHDRGGGLIYDDVLNVTWLQDVNHAMSSNYDEDGRMTWYEAKEWVENLEYYDSVRNIIWSDWRFPRALPVDGADYNYTYSYDGSTDKGYNISAPDSVYPDSTSNEMAFMFYNNLNNSGYYDVNGDQNPNGGLQNVSFESGGPGGPIVSFYNLQNAFYYTGNDYSDPNDNPNPPYVFAFYFAQGNQGRSDLNADDLVWAVRDGDVVPHTHCVGSSLELQNALNVSATNNTPDIIRIRSSENPYVGNFVYTSTESYGLTIEGGYTDELCTVRVVDPSDTVLDGEGNGRVLTLDCLGVDADLEVDGITVKNGHVTGNSFGGGLYAYTDGSMAVTRSTISNNHSNHTGGGAYIEAKEEISITDSKIIMNTSGGLVGKAGGIALLGSESVIMRDNDIISNVSGRSGGGILLWEIITVTLSNNTISANESGTEDTSEGGGAFIGHSSTISMTNNIINNNSASSGGGVYTDQGSTVALSNNIINNNIAELYGGGIRTAGDTTVILENNIIAYNTAQQFDGGGYFIAADLAIINLTNNIIAHNSANRNGGGVSTQSVSPVTLINNTINDNAAGESGGGIYVLLDYEIDVANIYNNIIWSNNASNGTDIYIKNGASINEPPSTVNLFNNDFDQSSEGTYIQDHSAVNSGNNLDNEDPKFDVDGSHLTKDSPCIDAGTSENTPDTDIDGDSRPQGDGYDIGADEYVVSDSDGDDIPDDEDACPFSDLSETVIIDGWDTGVENVLLADGCTISDLISQCADGAENHGEFVSSVSRTTNSLKKDGIISGKDKGMIQKGAAKANIP